MKVNIQTYKSKTGILMVNTGVGDTLGYIMINIQEIQNN